MCLLSRSAHLELPLEASRCVCHLIQVTSSGRRSFKWNQDCSFFILINNKHITSPPGPHAQTVGSILWVHPCPMACGVAVGWLWITGTSVGRSHPCGDAPAALNICDPEKRALAERKERPPAPLSRWQLTEPLNEPLLKRQCISVKKWLQPKPVWQEGMEIFQGFLLPSGPSRLSRSCDEREKFNSTCCKCLLILIWLLVPTQSVHTEAVQNQCKRALTEAAVCWTPHAEWCMWKLLCMSHWWTEEVDNPRCGSFYAICMEFCAPSLKLI